MRSGLWAQGFVDSPPMGRPNHRNTQPFRVSWLGELWQAIRWGEVIALAIPFAAVLVPIARMMGSGALTMEEGNILVVAAGILEGRLPHADVNYLYAPGTPWTVAGAFSLFGTTVAVERLVGLAHRLLLIWGVQRLARRWGLSTAACAALATWMVLAPFGLIAYPWVAGLSFLVAGAALVLDGEDRRSAAVGAALCGLSVVHQIVFLPAALLVVGLTFNSADSDRRTRLGTGLVAGLSPLLLHLVLVGPRAMFDGMVVDPIFRLRAGRRLPLPPDPSDSGDFFARLDDFLRGPETLPGLDRPTQIAALFWLLIAGTALLVIAAWRWRGSARNRLIVMVTVAAALVPMALQRPSPNHLKFVGSWTVAVGVVVIAGSLGRRLGRRSRHSAPFITLAIVLGGLVLLAPHHIGRFSFNAFFDGPFNSSTATVVNDGRSIPVGRGSSAESVASELEIVVTLADSLTRPGDRLFVGPADLTRTNYSDTFIYFLLPDLVPASRHLEMNPGLANRVGGNLAAELAEADLLILTPRFDGWSEPNSSVEPGDPSASAVVANQFCERGGTATWRIFTPCSATDDL